MPPKAEKTASPPTPTDELLARFQLQNERALSAARADFTRLHEGLALKVAGLTDQVTDMVARVERQTTQLEEAVHHTRQGVAECNLALKEAVKAANAAAESAAVFEKLKESQPDFHAAVQGLERRLAAVVDTNTLLREQIERVSARVDELDAVAEEIEETRGDVRGLDLAVKNLDRMARTSAPVR